MLGSIGLKIAAGGLFVLAILAAIFKFISIGKTMEKAKSMQKVISNAQKVNKARADLTPAERKRMRDRHSR